MQYVTCHNQLKRNNMKKNSSLLAIATAIVLLATSGTKVNATDLWGAGIGFNQYGRTSFGKINCVGGYSTNTAALTAAVNGGTDNYGGGEWDTPGKYGVVGRGFNSTATDVQIVDAGGYATAAAASSAAKASFPAGGQYSYNVLVQTAFD